MAIFVLEAFTDVASVSLWCPAAIPPRPTKEDLAAVESFQFERELSAAGRIWTLDVGSDGSYLCHVVLGKELPPHLVPYVDVDDPIEMSGFPIPSGELRFTGLEHISPAVSTDLARRQGESCRVPPGPYSLRIMRVETPDEVLESEFLRLAGPRGPRHLNAPTIFGVVAVGLLGAALAFALLVQWYVAASVLAALGLFSVALAIWWARSTQCRIARAQWLEVQRKYPSIVVMLSPRLSA